MVRNVWAYICKGAGGGWNSAEYIVERPGTGIGFFPLGNYILEFFSGSYAYDGAGTLFYPGSTAASTYILTMLADDGKTPISYVLITEPQETPANIALLRQMRIAPIQVGAQTNRAAAWSSLPSITKRKRRTPLRVGPFVSSDAADQKHQQISVGVTSAITLKTPADRRTDDAKL